MSAQAVRASDGGEDHTEFGAVVQVAVDHCVGCGACVRQCPANANRIRQGRAAIIPEHCIGCGRCVGVCTQRARDFTSDWRQVENAMRSCDVVAMVAPSFPAAFDARPGQVVAALRRIGFAGVYEVAFGADLVSVRYRRSELSVHPQPIVSTPCAAAVEFVRRHAPDVVPSLAPVMSPMAAMGRVLKEKARPGCWTAFVGPCSAKALEAKDPAVRPWVDAVVTFTEIRRLFSTLCIDLHTLDDEEFDPPHSYLGGVMPLPGGLTEGAGLDTDIVENRVTRICGPDELLMLVSRLREHGVTGNRDGRGPEFYEVLLCPGCIGGPRLLNDCDSNVHLLSSKDRIVAHVRSRQGPEQRGRWLSALDRFRDVDLSRTFVPCAPCAQPTREAVEPAGRQAKTTLRPALDSNGAIDDRGRATASEEDEATPPSLRREHAQRSFLKMVAHEIKAPLGVVEGYLHLIRDGAYEERPEKRRDVANRCLERTNALLEMVQDLLEIERRDAMLARHRSDYDVDLVAVVEDAIAFHRPEIERCALRVTLDVAPDAPPMPVRLAADRAELDRVLTNLVSNAIKYNRPGGQIEVRVGSVDGAVTLEVEDTGIGMSSDEMKRLGEEFYRVKNARTRHITGTGLGIALVKRVVQGCGGGLEIRSCPEVGSTFRVVLPNGRAAEPGAPVGDTIMRSLAVLSAQEEARFIPVDRIWKLLREDATPEPSRVREIIAKARELKGLGPEDVAALLRTDEPELVSEMFAAARGIKDDIYGKRLVLFAPLYYSSHCVNNCLYCGFRKDNPQPRRRLTLEEVAHEVRVLEDQGHKRLLVIGGEDPGSKAVDYLVDVINTVYATRSGTKGEIRRVNVEAAPMSVQDFARLKDAKIGTYVLFQETYDPENYRVMHPSGPKANYHWRLTALDRAMQAGLNDVGIGALLGLFDYRFEVLAMFYHAAHLEECFGAGPHTISVPRIETAEGAPMAMQPPAPLSDEHFRKVVAIIRMAVPYTGIILSTRERAELRTQLLDLGVSQMSGGSRTNPGGYTEAAAGRDEDVAQFAVGDHRTLDEVIADIAEHGYVPSFCTGCYRKGRTGQDFMDLAKPGLIRMHCLPNALFTFREYLEDYASPRTREIGERVIAEQLAKEVPEARVPHVKDVLLRIRKGERDVYF